MELVTGATGYVGGRLMRRMIEIGRAKALVGFTADVFASNSGMLMVFQRSGLRVQSQFDGGMYHLVLRLDDLNGEAIRSSGGVTTRL